MNEQIRISPIRLIGAEGEQLGLVPTSQALEKAREAGLDLVEVAADERPPVCRILDYGKMRFATSQKGNKAGKVRQQKLKEIRVRPKTGDHDVDTKVAQARKFLEHNDKVQVTVLFRGREMQHQEEGRRVLDSVLEKLADAGKVERPPTMDGKKMTALIMPNKSAAKPKPKPPAETKPVVAEANTHVAEQKAPALRPGRVSLQLCSILPHLAVAIRACSGRTWRRLSFRHQQLRQELMSRERDRRDCLPAGGALAACLVHAGRVVAHLAQQPSSQSAQIAPRRRKSWWRGVRRTARPCIGPCNGTRGCRTDAGTRSARPRPRSARPVSPWIRVGC